MVLGPDPERVHFAEASPVPREHDPPWYHWQDPGLNLRVQVVLVFQAPGVPWPEFRFRSASP